MRTAVQTIVIAVLVAIYAAVGVAILHPHVSQAYRAYFISRTSSDYDPPHYHTTPEQGMMFSRPGLPDWVLAARGFSVREDWGRWTDSNLAPTPGLTFNRKFDGDLCVDITFRAVAWVVGDTIKLHMDGAAAPLTISGEGPTEYQVLLSNLKEADKLDFVLPPGVPAVVERWRHSADPRRLAINISTLLLLPGRCEASAK